MFIFALILREVLIQLIILEAILSFVLVIMDWITVNSVHISLFLRSFHECKVVRQKQLHIVLPQKWPEFSQAPLLTIENKHEPWNG